MIKKLTFVQRLKLAYQTFKNANRLPFKLVTGTEMECEGILPSQLSALPVKLYLCVIDENGKTGRYHINPFKIF